MYIKDIFNAFMNTMEKKLISVFMKKFGNPLLDLTVNKH